MLIPKVLPIIWPIVKLYHTRLKVGVGGGGGGYNEVCKK